VLARRFAEAARISVRFVSLRAESTRYAKEDPPRGIFTNLVAVTPRRRERCAFASRRDPVNKRARETLTRMGALIALKK